MIFYIFYAFCFITINCTLKLFRFADPGYRLHLPKARCANVHGDHTALIVQEQDVTESTSPGLDEKFKGCKTKCDEVEECRYFSIRSTQNDCYLFRSCDVLVPIADYALLFSKQIKGTIA